MVSPLVNKVFVCLYLNYEVTRVSIDMRLSLS